MVFTKRGLSDTRMPKKRKMNSSSHIQLSSKKSDFPFLLRRSGGASLFAQSLRRSVGRGSVTIDLLAPYFHTFPLYFLSDSHNKRRTREILSSLRRRRRKEPSLRTREYEGEREILFVVRRLHPFFMHCFIHPAHRPRSSCVKYRK